MILSVTNTACRRLLSYTGIIIILYVKFYYKFCNIMCLCLNEPFSILYSLLKHTQTHPSACIIIKYYVVVKFKPARFTSPRFLSSYPASEIPLHTILYHVCVQQIYSLVCRMHIHINPNYIGRIMVKNVKRKRDYTLLYSLQALFISVHCACNKKFLFKTLNKARFCKKKQCARVHCVVIFIKCAHLFIWGGRGQSFKALNFMVNSKMVIKCNFSLNN